MQKETYDFIMAVLEVNRNQLIATRMYLQHQVALPEHLRVLEQPEEEAEKTIKTLALQILDYDTAISQLRNRINGQFIQYSVSPT